MAFHTKRAHSDRDRRCLGILAHESKERKFVAREQEFQNAARPSWRGSGTGCMRDGPSAGFKRVGT
eukprot:6492742-Amphidinium_carterae.2